MQKISNFQVYNASAGSGKTFTLVKEYLKILVQSSDVFQFQKILAITFTNKAAAEMKSRVLENLEAFSRGEENVYLHTILAETTLDKKVIASKSFKIFNAILKNYAAFSVITIDSFTHKIIKSFAFDLGLSLNFEVEMNPKQLLAEAVDIVLSKIGIDEKMTQLLIDFSLEKIDNDTSWDISHELNDISRILLSEKDTKHFRKLEHKSIEDFLILKKELQKSTKNIESEFSKLGNEVLRFIKDKGLVNLDFSYQDFPNHFIKYTNLKFLKNGAIKFENSRLYKNIADDKNLFGGKASSSSKSIIEEVKEDLICYYKDSKLLFDDLYESYQFHKLALKSIVPLAVLNSINLELSALKEENNIRLNAEFNQLISDNIKEQPAPFIYERIGQKFQYYFIDEMQDTSVLQWQNLIPLVTNALAQENSNLMLVGDAKQAIYRWRGGEASQFINLGTTNVHETPSFIGAKEVKLLETNFRSYTEVINFNNQFFEHLSGFLQNETYQKLYQEGSRQKENAKKGGFVSLSFLEKEEDKDDEQLKFPKKIYEIIRNLDPEISLGDVCVLVRKNKHGVAIANYLSEKGLEIVSPESLLLENSTKVNFIISLLKGIQSPEDKETWLEVLYFLHKHLYVKEKKHFFISRFMYLPMTELLDLLALYGIVFDIQSFRQFPFYEKIEYIIRSFKLVKTSDAYVLFFLDTVLKQHQRGTNIQDFLDFWEQQKDALSISTPENKSAVRIMTIHKSKGLEFPVVIFAYDIDIYRQINPKAWFTNLPQKTFAGFEELLLGAGPAIKDLNEQGTRIYNQERAAMELDNFNLLYVALTRAEEQLYVVTEKKISSKGENTNFCSGIFINYLKTEGLWNSEVLEYSFGQPKKQVPADEKVQESLCSEIQEQFISTPWDEHRIHIVASSSKLWGTEKKKAIDYGDLIHEIMAQIISEKEVDSVLQQFTQLGYIKEEEKNEIHLKIIEILKHPKLCFYFSDQVTVLNEREIILDSGEVVIPDRLVINKSNEVIIIDYKTGLPSEKHQFQLNKYENALKLIGFTVTKKILLYISNSLMIREF